MLSAPTPREQRPQLYDAPLTCDTPRAAHDRLLALVNGDTESTNLLLQYGADAVHGLTGGLAVGNLAVQADHRGQSTAAAALYFKATRVLGGALAEVRGAKESRLTAASGGRSVTGERARYKLHS